MSPADHMSKEPTKKKQTWEQWTVETKKWTVVRTRNGSHHSSSVSSEKCFMDLLSRPALWMKTWFWPTKSSTYSLHPNINLNQVLIALNYFLVSCFIYFFTRAPGDVSWPIECPKPKILANTQFQLKWKGTKYLHVTSSRPSCKLHAVHACMKPLA